MQEQNPRYHETKQDFRDALAQLGLSYERRKAGKLKGRWVFKGLRFRQEAESFVAPAAAKVVDIFTRLERNK